MKQAQSVKRALSKTKSKAKSKAKSVLQEVPNLFKQEPLQPIVVPITSTDVIRYRYHHGVNLGSIFVLEEWLSYSMFFHPPPGNSELDAVTKYVKEYGFDATKAKWEGHWTEPVSEDEFKWLATEAKVTSIRLPIGYFTLGEEWCVGTPFEEVKGVYVNAWQKVKEFTVAATRWGIGTLIDFHGTSSGKAELWMSQQNRDAAKNALIFIAKEVKSGALQGVVGIQLVNESKRWPNYMYKWYDEVIRRIGKVDESIPIYISDAWNLETCLQWTIERNMFTYTPRNPIVVDTHKYYCFGEKDKLRTPQQIIDGIPQEFAELKGREGRLSDRGEAQIIVGEWSCVFDNQTWARVNPPAGEKERLVRLFGQAQSKKWQEKTGGSYFWTYKNELTPEGEWGFETQTRKQNISPPESLTLTSQEVLRRVQNAHLQREALRTNALVAHGKYWNKKDPGKTYNHALWSQGWEVGWDDALDFFKMRSSGALGTAIQNIGGDKIGCLEIWVKKRLLESRIPEELVWEVEHGFRKGVRDFYTCVDI